MRVTIDSPSIAALVDIDCQVPGIVVSLFWVQGWHSLWPRARDVRVQSHPWLSTLCRENTACPDCAT